MAQVPITIYAMVGLGVLVTVWSLVVIVYRERHNGNGRHVAPPRSAHNDADYECVYWWGDRQESIGARCRICNPEGVNVLGTKDPV